MRLEPANISNLGNDPGGIDLANPGDRDDRIGNDLELLLNGGLELLEVLTLRLCPNIFMLHPYLGMQPRARAGGICCTISLPANQNDLPFAVLPRMIKRF